MQWPLSASKVLLRMQYNDDIPISIHKMNAYLHLHELVNALRSHPFGMQSLYLCLQKLLSVKM